MTSDDPLTPGESRFPEVTGRDVAGHARLWTPWRMRYVAEGVREAGCLFCNRFSETVDVDSLVLHRGNHAFIIMNLFPYNTGHVMIVPTSHIASPEEADAETLVELALLRGPLLRSIRRALNVDGFNVGLNIGSVAGAGIAAHLHEHVVPRWHGDANFMPLLASTVVMPELIPATYAKIRAELAREFGSGNQAVNIVFSQDRDRVLANDDGSLPRITAVEGEPIWKTLMKAAGANGALDVQLMGWASEHQAGSGPVALAHSAGPGPQSSRHNCVGWHTIESALAGPDATLLSSALRRYPGTD